MDASFFGFKGGNWVLALHRLHRCSFVVFELGSGTTLFADCNFVLSDLTNLWPWHCWGFTVILFIALAELYLDNKTCFDRGGLVICGGPWAISPFCILVDVN